MNTAVITDINDIWGSANFANKITPASAHQVFWFTFRNMRSLIGDPQDFINNYLGGITPDAPAYTFTGCINLTNYATLHANWK